ncbi:MAG: DUF3450 family protein [Sumerlaeia bacterium]
MNRNVMNSILGLKVSLSKMGFQSRQLLPLVIAGGLACFTASLLPGQQSAASQLRSFAEQKKEVEAPVAAPAASSSTSSETAQRIDTARESLQQWVETERLISKEKRDLELSREVLQERIALVQQEIESLRGKITSAEESIAEADLKRAELMETNDKLKQASASLAAIVASLEERTLTLLGQLPEPIKDRVRPLSQRIPKAGEETKLSTSERFQNVVGILNEMNKFNREITVTSEVRTLEDGSSAEVTALYMGIGQAFYSGGNGTIAGVGTATNEGWSWKSANDHAAEIARAIAILKNEQVASFVHVPVEVK